MIGLSALGALLLFAMALCRKIFRRNSPEDKTKDSSSEEEKGEESVDTTKDSSSEGEEEEESVNRTKDSAEDNIRRGLVVVDGNHHTIAIATLCATEIKYSKTIKI